MRFGSGDRWTIVVTVTSAGELPGPPFVKIWPSLY